MIDEPQHLGAAFGAPPPGDWDEWLVACGPEAGFLQTSSWARMMHARLCAVSYVLTVEHAGARLAGALVSHVPAGMASRDWLRRGKAWVEGRGNGELICLHGPVLLNGDKREALAALLAQVDALRARVGVGQVYFSGQPVLADWGDARAIASVFSRFRYREVPWLTSVVDLTQPEEKLLAGFKHAARKGIRKCVEAGLSVRAAQGYDEYRRDFYDPYIESLGTGPRPMSPGDRRWWQSGGRHYRFLVAKDGAGAVHATLGTYAFNGVATEVWSGRTAAGQKANVPAGDLLHWEAFRIHKAAGDKWFNLAGFSPEPRDAKEAGIRRFKEKWGGREVPVPQYLRGHVPLVARIARRLADRFRPRAR
jgi:hypothetical protein